MEVDMVSVTIYELVEEPAYVQAVRLEKRVMSMHMVNGHGTARRRRLNSTLLTQVSFRFITVICFPDSLYFVTLLAPTNWACWPIYLSSSSVLTLVPAFLNAVLKFSVTSFLRASFALRRVFSSSV